MPTAGSPISIRLNGQVSAYSARSSSRCSTHADAGPWRCWAAWCTWSQFLFSLVSGSVAGRSPNLDQALGVRDPGGGAEEHRSVEPLGELVGQRSGSPWPPRCPRARASGPWRTWRSCGCPARSGSCACPGRRRRPPPGRPSRPCRRTEKKGSAATFRPTCFMHTRARAPAMEAPMPTSMATFSLGDHSE